MSRQLQGDLQGKGLKIGVVVSRFNEFITSRLLVGGKAALARQGVLDEDVTVAWVPGSFELPVVAKKMAESGRYNAVICLGAVIKGDTDHYAYVASEAAKGIASVSLSTGTPVIFGVLTTDTVEQAIERAGGENGKYVEALRVTSKGHPDNRASGDEHGNVGYNAGVAAIEMANLVRALDED